MATLENALSIMCCKLIFMPHPIFQLNAPFQPGYPHTQGLFNNFTKNDKQ